MQTATETTEEILDAIDAEADRVETPCGDGRMAWRIWGSGSPLVLLHGAFGSWMHWVRNVLPLAEVFQVIVPDMPGYGDSAMPPEPYSPESLAEIIIEGLARIVPSSARLDMAGFSFGGIIAGHVAAHLGERLNMLVLIGPNGMALPIEEAAPVQRLGADMTEAEIAAVHRHNLSILMIADPSKVDDLAVHIQVTNARDSRVKSGDIPYSDSLLRVLPKVRARLCGIWGACDAMAAPYLDQRRSTLTRFQPDLDFRLIDGAGHWVPFEAPDAVNAAILDMVGRQ